MQLCGDVSERAPDLEGREGQITGGGEVWVRLSKARERRNTYPALLTLLLPRPTWGWMRGETELRCAVKGATNVVEKREVRRRRRRRH